MSELCHDCAKPILMGQGSYYRKDPACDIGRTYHSECGDPFGLKAKDAEIGRLRSVNADMLAALELAVMAKTRLDDFADKANAGQVHYSARELKRKIGAAFADFDAALAKATGATP